MPRQLQTRLLPEIASPRFRVAKDTQNKLSIPRERTQKKEEKPHSSKIFR